MISNHRTTRTSTGRALAAALCLAASLAPEFARGATELSARASQSRIADGDTFDLLVSAKGDAPSAAPDLSVLQRDFEILGRRQSQRLSVVNGRTEASHDWIVTLAPKRTGALTIPSIQAGDAATEPITIEVGAQAGAPHPGSATAPTRPPGGAARSPDLFVEASVDQDSPVVQSEIRYTVRVYDALGMRDGTLTEPSAEGVRFQAAGEPRTYEETVGGRRYRVYERAFTANPEASGEVTIPPVSLQARVPASRAEAGAHSPFDDLEDDPFGDPFEDAFAGIPRGFGLASRMLEEMMGGRSVRVRSNPVSVSVKARPGAATGEWFLPAKSASLESSWTPAKPTFRVGEAIERTVTLRVLGSSAERLPRFAIPAPAGARQYPEATRDGSATTQEGTLAILEQSVSIVPSEPGRMTIPAVEVRWWNVATETMQTARLAEEVVEILPATVSQQAAQATAPATSGAGAAIPRDTSPVPTQNTPPHAMSADPPSLASRLWSGDIAFGAAALAALLAGGALPTLRRRARAAAPPTPSPVVAGSPATTSHPSARRALAALKAACARDDAETAREALLAWVRAACPAEPPRTLGDVARKLGNADPRIALELRALDAARFGRDPARWSGGRALWKVIESASRSAMSPASAPSVDLPPLYPAHSRAARSAA